MVLYLNFLLYHISFLLSNYHFFIFSKFLALNRVGNSGILIAGYPKNIFRKEYLHLAGECWENIMYLENQINAETFQELWQQASEKPTKYDRVLISPKANMAAIRDYGHFRIKNAFIIVQSGTIWHEWEISDFKLLKCSGTFSFNAKSIRNIAVCVGEETEEPSYLFFKDMEEASSHDLFAIGAVETEKCILAFCFDWQNRKNQYLVADNYDGEDSDLFYIMRTLKELPDRKEDMNETAHTRCEYPMEGIQNGAST